MLLLVVVFIAGVVCGGIIMVAILAKEDRPEISGDQGR